MGERLLFLLQAKNLSFSAITEIGYKKCLFPFFFVVKTSDLVVLGTD